MDRKNRKDYSGGTMTTGSVREDADTGRWVTTTNGTNTIWRVFDGNGGSLPSSDLGNRYLFQGREYSWAIHAATGGTGLYNFRARWYDPVTSRWLSNDPVGISGGLNQYAFCANNPVMFGDPEGESFWGQKSTKISAVAIGATVVAAIVFTPATLPAWAVWAVLMDASLLSMGNSALEYAQSEQALAEQESRRLRVAAEHEAALKAEEARLWAEATDFSGERKRERDQRAREAYESFLNPQAINRRVISMTQDTPSARCEW